MYTNMRFLSSPSEIEKRATGDVEVVTVAWTQVPVKSLSRPNLETEFIILVRTKE